MFLAVTPIHGGSLDLVVLFGARAVVCVRTYAYAFVTNDFSSFPLSADGQQLGHAGDVQEELVHDGLHDGRRAGREGT